MEKKTREVDPKGREPGFDVMRAAEISLRLIKAHLETYMSITHGFTV